MSPNLLHVGPSSTVIDREVLIKAFRLLYVSRAPFGLSVASIITTLSVSHLRLVSYALLASGSWCADSSHLHPLRIRQQYLCQWYGVLWTDGLLINAALPWISKFEYAYWCDSRSWPGVQLDLAHSQLRPSRYLGFILLHTYYTILYFCCAAKQMWRLVIHSYECLRNARCALPNTFHIYRSSSSL